MLVQSEAGLSVRLEVSTALIAGYTGYAYTS